MDNNMDKKTMIENLARAAYERGSLNGAWLYAEGGEIVSKGALGFRDPENTLLQATCAIPLMFPVIHYEGKPLLDGGCADPIPWKQALERSRTLDRILVPYENAEGIAHTREVIGAIRPGESIGIFIGPEGGFEESEVRQLEEMGGSVITLGHRILRTDTASIATLAMLMLHLES